MKSNNFFEGEGQFPSLIKKLFPFILIALVISARAVPGLRTIDDAHITFRYAKNILSGNGFAYNPGEPIQGTTTPLYTLLLSLFGLVTGGSNAPFPLLALLINIISDTMTCLLIWKMSKQIRHELTGMAISLYWAIAPYSVTFAVGGLETSFFIFLLTTTFYFHLKGKYSLSAFLLALSILTRPDALLFSLLLIADRSLIAVKQQKPLRDKPSDQSKLLKDALVFTLPLLIWFGFALFYFGSPIPHSVIAKTRAYLLPENAAFIRLLQHYATPFLGQHTFGTFWIGVGLVLYPFVFIVGARILIRISPRFWPWIFYPWIYFAAFSIANPLIFRWYLTPPLLPYVFVIYVGLSTVLAQLSGFWEEHSPQPGRVKFLRLAISGLILIPVLLSLRAWELSPGHGPRRPAPQMAWFKLELFYREAAQIVMQEVESNTLIQNKKPVLAAGDVGVLGYETNLPILDLVGLNSPQSVSYYPLPEEHYAINYAVSVDLILDELPEYIVILEIYGRKTLLKNEDFLNKYQLLKILATDIYSSEGMLILKRIE